MGNERQYNPKGGFNEHLYDDHPAWTALNINGVRGKVITYVYDSKGIHTKLLPIQTPPICISEWTRQVR